MATESREKNLEAVVSELEALVKEFEEGKLTLEDGIEKFKHGVELAKSLKMRLSEMENEIEEIRADFADIDEQKSE